MTSEHNTMNSGDIPTRPPGPTDVNIPMGIRERGLILILSAIWGGSFFFVGVAVKEMTPLTIVLCRVGLASMILLVTFLIPVSATFLGVVVLGERPGGMRLVGWR
jgi:hypothetical protein